MNIELKAKELTKLYKKQKTLQTQLSIVHDDIRTFQEILRETFKDIGLESSFSG